MKKEEINERLEDYKFRMFKKLDLIKEIDNRLETYLNNCLNTPENHNLYEILAVFRFIDFLYKYEMKVNMVKKFILFYETLKFPSNKGMRSFDMTPIQAFIAANIYGFYKGDYRLIRSALLFVVRKFGKTQFAAGIALFDLIFGNPDAQAYIASNSFSQSQICYNMCKESLKCLDSKLSHFRLNRDIIYSKIQGRTSLVRCLASSADKLDGLNASTVIMDEYSQSDSAALKNVLETSMGVRNEPLTVIITTASGKLESPFTQMLDNYKKVLRGEIDNDSIFPLIFQPDEEDTDYSNPQLWRKVQPHLNTTVTESFYQAEWEKAQMSADDKFDFMTKLLNIFTIEETKEWIDNRMIDRNTQDLDLDKLKNKPEAMLSLDLSVKNDMSCVSVGMYSSLNKIFYFKNFYFIPKQTLLTHTNKEFYHTLYESGDLQICGDEIIDYGMIADFILGLGKKVKILQVLYDAYKATDCINTLKASKVKCVAYKQTNANYTSPVESFEIGLYNDRIKLDDNPLIKWNINNAVIDVDRMGNKKPIKRTANGKVDGIQCILMNLGGFMNWKRRA